MLSSKSSDNQILEMIEFETKSDKDILFIRVEPNIQNSTTQEDFFMDLTVAGSEI